MQETDIMPKRCKICDARSCHCMGGKYSGVVPSPEQIKQILIEAIQNQEIKSVWHEWPGESGV